MRNLLSILFACICCAALHAGCAMLPRPTVSSASPQSDITLTRALLPSPEPTITGMPTSEPDAATTMPNDMDPQTAIIVNGRTISRDEYDLAWQQEYDAFIAQAGIRSADVTADVLAFLHNRVRSQFIDRILLQQAALSLGITITQEQVNTEIAALRGADEASFQHWLELNHLTEAQLAGQFADQLLTGAVRDAVTRDMGREHPHRHVRYLVTASLEEAEMARQALGAGADFADVVAQYCSDISLHASGGDVGFVPRGILPLAVDQAADRLALHELSEIIQADTGYYLIEVLEIAESMPVSDEHWPFVLQARFQEWLANERALAEIAINPALE